ncbi:MAG: ATP-binding cassette domain-containing protein, partial [Rhodospirillales bacterium]|nr:ATP-binding cassette domain-containing protein [Rhodospirillales bacterium]
MAEDLIALARIGVRFGGHDVLRGVDLKVTAGQVLTIVGPNGAGKSTLLRVALGLVVPEMGSVWRRPALVLGYVPQKLALEPTLPLTARRFLSLALPGRVVEAELRAALAEVRAEHVLDRQMLGLSGGEMQRVLLARAMLRKPELMVL